MKLYSKHVTLQYTADKLLLELHHDLKIEYMKENFEDCFIEINNETISLTGSHIVRYYQSRLCKEIDFNKNKRILPSEVMDKYTKTKRHFFFGSKYTIIKDGWFELKEKKMRTITSDSFSVCNLMDGTILDVKEFEEYQKLIKKSCD